MAPTIGEFYKERIEMLHLELPYGKGTLLVELQEGRIKAVLILFLNKTVSFY